VWLGLLAEDYRESRQDLMAEHVSLARLVRDLEFDRQDMTGNLQRTVDGRAAISTVSSTSRSSSQTHPSTLH
jgi:hypothetical protein